MTSHTDKLSAMERAFQSVMARKDMPDDADPGYDRWLFDAAILTYLSSLGDDDVEACKAAIVKEMDEMSAVYGSDARMFDLQALRVKTVLSTLIKRAKESGT